MTYTLEDKPRAWIMEPTLQKIDGRLIHSFAGDRLCLYLPRPGEWCGSMYLADTMVPWTSDGNSGERGTHGHGYTLAWARQHPNCVPPPRDGRGSGRNGS